MDKQHPHLSHPTPQKATAVFTPETSVNSPAQLLDLLKKMKDNVLAPFHEVLMDLGFLVSSRGFLLLVDAKAINDKIVPQEAGIYFYKDGEFQTNREAKTEGIHVLMHPSLRVMVEITEEFIESINKKAADDQTKIWALLVYAELKNNRIYIIPGIWDGAQALPVLIERDREASPNLDDLAAIIR